jgi:hypothetical protein
MMTKIRNFGIANPEMRLPKPKPNQPSALADFVQRVSGRASRASVGRLHLSTILFTLNLLTYEFLLLWSPYFTDDLA